MRFLGAKVVLTPAALKGSGMLAKAVELAGEHGWFLARQFENEANADAHSRTTAPEILEAFADTHLDYWVTGFGTGGEHIGGATELFDAANDGELEKLLKKHNVVWNEAADQDPYSFLPQWLHAR